MNYKNMNYLLALIAIHFINNIIQVLMFHHGWKDLDGPDQ